MYLSDACPDYCRVPIGPIGATYYLLSYSALFPVAYVYCPLRIALPTLTSVCV